MSRATSISVVPHNSAREALLVELGIESLLYEVSVQGGTPLGAIPMGVGERRGFVQTLAFGGCLIIKPEPSNRQDICTALSPVLRTSRKV